MRLSKDDILKAAGPRTEEVEVPEWGGSVLVRGMTGRERDEFEASLMERRGNEMVPAIHNVRARLMVQCCVDDGGTPLFGVTDIELLGEKSGAALNRVYEVAARLSGLSESDVEELAANFSGTPSGSSSSTSPNGSAG